VPPQPEP
jgi:hypothetical protein